MSKSGFNMNLKPLADSIERMKKQFETDVQELVEFTVSEIELEAIRNAPGPGDRIAILGGKSLSQETIRRDRNWIPISQGIISYTENTNEGIFGGITIEESVGPIWAYVEFGTGQDAASYVPTLPKEWQDIARIYFIDGKGRIIHKPFLYPAFVKGEAEFLKELKLILSKLKL